MRINDLKRFLVTEAIVCGLMLLLGTIAGWSINDRIHQQAEQQLAADKITIDDAATALKQVIAERDQYKKQAQGNSGIIRVIYRGSLKETANDSGPEEAWREFELTRDNPHNGTIYVSDLGEIAKYAQHDAKVNEQVLAYVVNTFGSTEESGPGR